MQLSARFRSVFGVFHAAVAERKSYLIKPKGFKGLVVFLASGMLYLVALECMRPMSPSLSQMNHVPHDRLANSIALQG